jgi:hypothetical protein
MIIIGYDRNGLPMSIVSAKSVENAHAYWQGTGEIPDSTKIFDITEDRENEKLGFVTPFLKTKINIINKYGTYYKEVEIREVIK